MYRIFVAALVTTGVLAAAPVMAQQGQSQTSKEIQSQKVMVPVQIEVKQMMKLQEKLNKEGFSAGPVNGAWDRETAAAVHNFQVQKGLEPTGVLDDKTLSALGIKLESASSSSSSSSSSSGSSQMSQQQAQQELQSQGYSQVQLSQEGQDFTGTASKSEKQYQIQVSQNGQVQATPQQ